jgi:hypothetical protein
VSNERSFNAILRFWLPLAATWLMMAIEGPLLAAVIARLADAKFNLAAHGVAVAFAILVEAPVIMMMSASTALVEDAHTFRKLRAFAYALNALVTVLMLVTLIPPVFTTVMQKLIGLPDEVAHLTYGALWLLLPWPGTIGYRRFFHGLLIREGRTRLVAYGTIIRLSAMSTTALVLFAVEIPGAYVGAAALSVGVTLEAVASRFMARSTVKRLLGRKGEAHEPSRALTYRRITHFYYPLALTSLIGLAAHPMLTFFMGQARLPVESLAVFPVVNALSFVFRAVGLSFQETAVALLGRNNVYARELGHFALILAIAASGALTLIAFTPVADFWLVTVSGLPPDLAYYAKIPLRVLAPLPAFSVLLSYQRGLLVNGRATRPITGATILEVSSIALLFITFGFGLDLVGATAAVTAFVLGRIASNAYLVPACLTAARFTRGQP